jgi:hypothetical protein
MSLTITQSPSTNILSGNNPAVFVLSSSNATQVDMKYRADIYMNGSFLTTQKDFPDPTKGYFGKFDLSEISSNLFGYDFLPSGTIGFVSCSNSSVVLQAKFGEEFTDSLGNFSQSLYEISSSNLTFINSSLGFADFVNDNMNDYYLDGTTQKKCLSKKNNNLFLSYTNLNQWLYYYNASGSAYQANIFTYNATGEPLGIYSVPNPLSGSTGIQAFGSGYPNLQSLTTSSYSVVAGGYPMITSNVAYYFINFGSLGTLPEFVTDYDGFFMIDSDGGLISDGYVADYFLGDSDGFNLLDSDGGFLDSGIIQNGTPSTIFYQYNVTPNCGKYAPGSVAIMWLNVLGGIDSFYFTKVNTTTVTKTQSQYKKAPGQLHSNGTYTFETSSPQMVTYYTELQETHELNSDWLDDSTILWLKDLFSSPLVWMRAPSGNTYPVVVKDDTYSISKKVNTKLFQLKLTIDSGFTDYRQKIS